MSDYKYKGMDVYEISSAQDSEIDNLETQAEALKAQLAEAQAANKELTWQNEKLRQHIEQRANGADPLATLLRKEKWDAIEELKKAQAVIERQRAALDSVVVRAGRMSRGAWAVGDTNTSRAFDAIKEEAQLGLGADHA